MLLRRLIRHIRRENWFAVSLDLLIVVVGIFLGFQVDRWYEGMRDLRTERMYLQRLRSDLETEKKQFQAIVARTEIRLEQIGLLETALARPEDVAGRPADFVRAIEQVTWRSFPVITAYTYSELLSSGRMTLLRSEELRRSLAEYYAQIEDARRLGFGEDDQSRFRDLTVGLLSAAHLSAIEDASRYTLHVQEMEAVHIAHGLAARGGSAHWLTRLTKYQVLMRARAAFFAARADTLLQIIDETLPAST